MSALPSSFLKINANDIFIAFLSVWTTADDKFVFIVIL